MTTPTGAGDGSIRDRLRSPAGHGEQNSGGDSRHSSVSESDFQQTDSHATSGGHLPMAGVAEAHEPRHAPLSAQEAKVAERKVAALFVLSFIGVVGFFVTYWGAPWLYGEANYERFTPLLGIFMTLALAGLGAGAVLWAKTLMVDEETTQERHPFASPEAERVLAGEALVQGGQDSGLPRRRLLLGSLLLGGGALAALPVPLLFGLGPYAHKENVLLTTGWRKGVRLMRQNGSPVKLGDLDIGSAETVFPMVPDGANLPDSATLLIRMRPEDVHAPKGQESWSYEGHLAYSVICTHLGCPVKLYEQQTHHLFCPCHQSTFDASRGCHVLFGPAARPLPQLAISVDAEGYFVAQGDYSQAIGPSFWERN
ncbi:MAG: Rieske (2Fe-2S) protein [Actinomycetota bacterium]|nr:Rieske (2Fe-2S) protein [Actinomycetota bacterium]